MPGTKGDARIDDAVAAAPVTQYREITLNSTSFLLFVHTSGAGGTALCEAMQKAECLLRRDFGQSHVCLEQMDSSWHSVDAAREAREASILLSRVWNPFHRYGNLSGIEQHLHATRRAAISLESRNLRFEEFGHDCCDLPARELWQERLRMRHWFFISTD